MALINFFKDYFITDTNAGTNLIWHLPFYIFGWFVFNTEYYFLYEDYLFYEDEFVDIFDTDDYDVDSVLDLFDYDYWF